MDVTTAVSRRKSVRAFLPTPVSDETITQLLEKAARAPSGGNVQPWKVYVVNGESMTRFRSFLGDRKPGQAGYPVYPESLKEPYRTARFQLGEAMYATIGIPRDDKPARLRQMAKNYDFFGAPSAIFCYVDRQMGSAQWSDLGMFLQTFMLLVTEAGLDTCPQEAWARYEAAITEFVGAPDELQLVCGVALGHADTEHPINTLESQRFSVADFATWV